MMRRAGVAAALVLALLAAPAWADQASKLAGIRHYLDVIGMNSTLLRMIDPLTEQYMASFARMRPDAVDEAQAAMRAILQREFTQGLPDLLDGVVRLYDAAFGEEEIAALVAFFDSPAGRKFMQVSPQLQRDSAALGLEWGRRMAEQAGQAFEETYKPKP